MDNTLSAEPVVEIPSAILLSGFIHSFLLGIIITQYAKYLADYRDDSFRKRAFVASVVLVSMLQTILEDYKSWRTVINKKPWVALSLTRVFGSTVFPTLQSTSKLQWSDLFLNGLLSSLCEGFFIRRCWKVSNKSLWVVFPLSFLLVTLLIATIYLAVAMGVAFRFLTSGTSDTLHASPGILISSIVAFSYWIYGSLVLDATVTTIMVKFLWRSRTGLVELDQIVKQIVIITLKSAALPSICMLVAAAVTHISSHLKNHPVLFFVLLTGKFYAMGMLIALNSRGKLRERMKARDIVRHTGRLSFSQLPWDAVTNLEMAPRNRGSLHELSRTLDTSALRSALALVPAPSMDSDGGVVHRESIAQDEVSRQQSFRRGDNELERH